MWYMDFHQLITLIFLLYLRLVLEFDLLFYAFGKLGTVTWAWIVMFVYTLLVPYCALVFWGSLYHSFPYKLGLSLGTGLILSAIQTYVLGLFPIYVVIENQLPPASRFIVILEQVSKWACFMKTTSLIVNRAWDLMNQLNVNDSDTKLHMWSNANNSSPNGYSLLYISQISFRFHPSRGLNKLFAVPVAVD